MYTRPLIGGFALLLGCSEYDFKSMNDGTPGMDTAAPRAEEPAPEEEEEEAPAEEEPTEPEAPAEDIDSATHAPRS